jgi:regulator of nucleoside diphosphate kinase
MTMQINTVVAHNRPGKPPLVLDAAHYGKLHDLAWAALDRAPDVASLLLDELERADVRPSGEMPPDVVNIGSEVTFRYNDNGQSQTIRLVLPNEADINQGRVSVFTPIGATLLGLAEGDEMEWTTRQGETRSLTILKVRQLDEQLPSTAGLAPWL